MIESIFGKIVSITNNDLVINVGPINLSILIPSSDKYLSLKSGDTQIEATKAVEALGYPPDQIKKIINEINLSDQYKQSLTSEELIRIVLDKISIIYD